MSAVLTIDQRRSQQGELLTPDWVTHLNEAHDADLERPFVITAGDEIQAVVRDPSVVVDVVAEGIRKRHWWVGVGLGAMSRPLGETAAMSHGEAFVQARKAVGSAKRSPYGFAVRGSDSEQAKAVETVLKLVGYILRRRGEPSRSKRWEAIALAEQGLTMEEIAERLGVSHQAISARLRTAGYEEEREGRAVARQLLSTAMSDDDDGL